MARKPLSRWLIVGDGILCLVAWLGAWGIRRLMDGFLERPVSPLPRHLVVLAAVVPLWLVVNAAKGLYRRPLSLGRFREFQGLLHSSLAALLAAMVLSYAFKELEVARLVVFLAPILTLVFALGYRAQVRRWVASYAREHGPLVRTVVVGTSPLASALAARLPRNPGWQALVGYVGPAEAPSPLPHLQRLGDSSQLPDLVRTYGINEVYLALPEWDRSQILDMVAACHGLPVTFKLVMGLFEAAALQGSLDETVGMPVIEFGPGTLSHGESVAKRLLDLTLAVLVGVACLPLALAVAVAIRVDSPGPILFRHTRVGKDGKPFTMFKFRTMYQDVDPFQPAPRSQDDPRITRVGRWLRRTSVDELPQIINVLNGTMSFVGPRPEMPFIVERYQGWQAHRLSVKPGITGLWQIMGRKDLPLEENLEFDFYYIRNQSLLLDLTILLRTIPIVFMGKGAY